MARHLWGGVADYVIALGADNAATLQPGATVTCWSAVSGGSQYTDLLESDGSTPIPDGQLTADAVGAVPEFFGPDGVTSLYFDASGGSGPRRRAVPTDTADTASAAGQDLTTHEGQVNPHSTRYSDLADTAVPTITDMLVLDPFSIAHRGSGGEFPEHTLAAYLSALAAGATAIEVSVHLTADGVPVCFHDTTLDRMTDATGPIADWTYAALREAVKVKAQGTLGTGWSDQTIPTLRDVLDALYGRCVIFLEAKSNDAITPVRDMVLAHYPGYTESIVWKAHYTQAGLDTRKSEGWTVWAYMDAGTLDSALDAVDNDVDWWGVPTAMTDTRVGDVVARGKPVIMWEIHRHVDVERATGLGVQGLMESRWVYLNNTPALTSDNFASAVAEPGMLGLAGYSENYALQFDGSGGAYLNTVPNAAVLMGGHRVDDGTSYTINFRMKWDTLPSTTSLHSGIAFARDKDDGYSFSATNDDYGALASAGGYHVVMRASGQMGLYSHTKGITSGTVLGGGQISTPAPTAGQWMEFEITVSPTQVILTRLDSGGPYTITSGNTDYRGRYWHLSGNSSDETPTWDTIAIA